MKFYEFLVKGQKVRIAKTWFHKAKLYVDGELRDFSTVTFMIGSKPLLSANLGDAGTLEVYPRSGLITVDVDAYLLKDSNKQYVYSSYKYLTVREQRLAK